MDRPSASDRFSPGVGEKLRLERERRDTTLDAFSTATKIEPEYLRAIERNEIGALPGPAFGKFYIRVYGETLGFDPEPLIAEYEQERLAERRRTLERELAEPAGGAESEVAAGRSTEPTPEVESSAEERPAPQAEPILELKDELEAHHRFGAEDREEADAAAPAVEPERRCETVSEIETELGVEAAPGRGVGSPGSTVVETVTRPASAGSTDRRAWRPANARLRGGLIVVGLAVLAIALWALPGGSRRDRVEVDRPGLVPAPIDDARPSREPEAPGGPDATPPRSSEPSLQTPTEAATETEGRIRVAEFGVGTRMVDRRLEGRAERFAEGSVVWFATRVLGGRPGDSIRHVWLHEGRTMQIVELPLGGAHWRTRSRKTLQATGRWTVEARDGSDRVLARSSFLCVPAGS